jgi:2,3-bisphosphoglycerate-dependent phosphoglycerate mutase
MSEAAAAGRLLREANLLPEVAHTSLLRRAIDTLNITLAECDRGWIPVDRHWRLNERHYGALQGLDKKQTAAEHGADQVHVWRRSYNTPPPELESDDERHPGHDIRYGALPPEILPASECLEDVVERMMPYWYDAIVPQLRDGKIVIVAAHGNSLRALVKHLDGISDEEIPSLNIPTGIPLVYELDADLRKVASAYLGDPAAAAAAAAAVANQASTG